MNFLRKFKGQSLVELIIAIAIGAVLIGGATGALMVTLRSSYQNRFLRTASGLAQELMDKVTVYTEGRWRNIYDLSKVPTKWFLQSIGASFTASGGSETVTIEGVTYERYFTVENIQRDSTDNIVASGGNNDASTQLIKVYVNWTQVATPTNVMLARYFTRNTNRVWRSQSPGAGNESPIFNSGVTGGAALNNIMWQGSGGIVGFRIASDTEGDGPWNYLGPDGNPVIYYQPAGPNVQARITLDDHNNKQYFRYRIYYLSGSPSISDVIINYSL